MRFQALEKLINLHDGYSRTFKIDNLQLLLRQDNGQLYLIGATCPHRGHPLAEADIDGNTIECPLHGYRFDLATGRAVHITEAACSSLKAFELIYEGNEVGVMIEE